MPLDEVFSGGAAPFFSENMEALHYYNTKGEADLRVELAGGVCLQGTIEYGF